MPTETKTAETYIETPQTLAALRADLVERRVKAADLAAGYYERIEKKNPHLNVYLSLTKERALAQAERIDALAAKGDPLPPLAGIPVGIKDVLVMQGRAVSTAGSKILEGYHPPYDATVVSQASKRPARCCSARLNCDEFAMGSSNENSAYGPVRNPVDPERVPGGSSGGSAAAVAANLAVATLGTRHRRLHPPAGQLLRRGRRAAHLRARLALRPHRLCLLARSHRPLRRQRARCRHHARRDRRPRSQDATSSTGARGGLRCRERQARRRACASASRPSTSAKGSTRKSAPPSRRALPRLRPPAASEAGLAAAHQIRRPDLLPGRHSRSQRQPRALRRRALRLSLAALRELSPPCTRHSRDEGFGAEVKRRILLGTYALSAGYYDAYYLKAQQVRRLLAEEFLRAFAEVDAIVTPTSPVPAFKLGEKTGDPLAMYLADIYTVTASLAGICGVTVPCGATSAGLPGRHAGSGRAFW